ncbi:MAG: AIPR family protein [Steroidobacteraceae bacterium]
MTEEEFRADLMACAASRAETESTGAREAFVAEFLDRLREAQEVPDAEPCPEALIGYRGRKLEIDACAYDEADNSLHLFVAIHDGGATMPPVLTRAEARDQGFNHVVGMFEQARTGWLAGNIEESRPLWALARRIQLEAVPAALRAHVLTDRCLSERVREIAPEVTQEGIPLTFQIWDISRLKRIHEARSARDDLVVGFGDLPQGGLPVLRAAVGEAGYDAYLTVIPAAALADIYIRHGGRLLEGNVRTYLGRVGNVNRGIANTLAKEPEKFFAYNNGIAATACSVSLRTGQDGTLLLTEAADLQIVNGAQTTASLAGARRERKVPLDNVFVPMKLSVVPADLAGEMIPRISRYANSQNPVRASDFFANHEFHRRVEEISRRVLAPAVGGSQVQTHWFYERARGQHLNEQAGLAPAQKERFLRLNPRKQVIRKTDLAKVETCFELLPDIACKGAEKSFVEFANRISKEWADENRRLLYGDGWFRGAVARVILFKTAEVLVSNAPWYDGGYRAQIVAYTLARLAQLARDASDGGTIDWSRIWAMQAPDDVLCQQMLIIAEAMAGVLRSPPLAGQNIGEWAKQQACRKRALETGIAEVAGFRARLAGREDQKSARKAARSDGRVDRGVEAITEVMQKDAPFWQAVRAYARQRNLLFPEDERALHPAVNLPKMVPTDRQAERLISLLSRCEDAGFAG